MSFGKKQADSFLKKDTKDNRVSRDIGFASVGAGARVFIPKLGGKLINLLGSKWIYTKADNALDKALYKTDPTKSAIKNPKTIEVTNKLRKLLKKPLMREALISTSLAGTGFLASHIFSKINKS